MPARAMPRAAAELRRGTSTVRVGIEPGAPISAFEANGHDWCASGAWRDYAPTARACTLPTFVSGAAGAAFPDGGVLAVVEPTVDVHADGTISAISAWWPPSPYPLGWTREISLDDDGALVARYAVTNAQRAPLPFVWGIPVVLPWDDAVSIDLPRGARSRLAAVHGDSLPSPGSEFAWPALRDGGHLIDLAKPASLPPQQAVLCYVELPRARFAVRIGDALLEVRGDPGVVTHARVWVNHDAQIGAATRRRWWRRHVPHHAISVGPAVGAPDALTDAVGAWRAARWVEPGETVRWTIRCRALPPPS